MRVCLFVCVREREKERDTERVREILVVETMWYHRQESEDFFFNYVTWLIHTCVRVCVRVRVRVHVCVRVLVRVRVRVRVHMRVCMRERVCMPVRVLVRMDVCVLVHARVRVCCRVRVRVARHARMRELAQHNHTFLITSSLPFILSLSHSLSLCRDRQECTNLDFFSFVT